MNLKFFLIISACCSVSIQCITKKGKEINGLSGAPPETVSITNNQGGIGESSSMVTEDLSKKFVVKDDYSSQTIMYLDDQSSGMHVGLDSQNNNIVVADLNPSVQNISWQKGASLSHTVSFQSLGNPANKYPLLAFTKTYSFSVIEYKVCTTGCREGFTREPKVLISGFNGVSMGQVKVSVRECLSKRMVKIGFDSCQAWQEIDSSEFASAQLVNQAYDDLWATYWQADSTVKKNSRDLSAMIDEIIKASPQMNKNLPDGSLNPLYVYFAMGEYNFTEGALNGQFLPESNLNGVANSRTSLQLDQSIPHTSCFSIEDYQQLPAGQQCFVTHLLNQKSSKNIDSQFNPTNNSPTYYSWKNSMLCANKSCELDGGVSCVSREHLKLVISSANDCPKPQQLKPASTASTVLFVIGGVAFFIAVPEAVLVATVYMKAVMAADRNTPIILRALFGVGAIADIYNYRAGMFSMPTSVRRGAGVISVAGVVAGLISYLVIDQKKMNLDETTITDLQGKLTRMMNLEEGLSDNLLLLQQAATRL